MSTSVSAFSFSHAVLFVSASTASGLSADLSKSK